MEAGTLGIARLHRHPILDRTTRIHHEATKSSARVTDTALRRVVPPILGGFPADLRCR
jgi:hypothetical protein